MPIARATLESPFGPVTVTSDGACLTRVRFGPGREDVPAADPLLDEALSQLAAWFAGELQDFDLPLAPPDSPFQGRMRAAMIAIPYGRMRTYGELATELDSMPQAIGQACGANPIPIVVPCHRVVAGGGRLGGFSGGEGRVTKRQLLNHEAVHAPDAAFS